MIGVAIYHCSAKAVGRAGGRSSVAAAAYRAGAVLVDGRTGVVHDYSRRSGVLHTEVCAPAGCDWARDRAALWNAVEASVSRKNGRLGTELELAVPHELSRDRAVMLVRGFAAELTRQHGTAVDIALHAPDRRRQRDGLPGGDARNVHAHLMETWSEVTPAGIGRLVKPYDGPAKIEAVRALWAEHCNTALAAAGIDASVDHRSYARQGVDLTPAKHVGVQALGLEACGVETDRADQWRQVMEVRAVEAEIEAVGAEIVDLQAEREQRQQVARLLRPTEAEIAADIEASWEAERAEDAWRTLRTHELRQEMRDRLVAASDRLAGLSTRLDACSVRLVRQLSRPTEDEIAADIEAAWEAGRAEQRWIARQTAAARAQAAALISAAGEHLRGVSERLEIMGLFWRGKARRLEAPRTPAEPTVGEVAVEMGRLLAAPVTGALGWWQRRQDAARAAQEAQERAERARAAEVARAAQEAAEVAAERRQGLLEGVIVDLRSEIQPCRAGDSRLFIPYSDVHQWAARQGYSHDEAEWAWQRIIPDQQSPEVATRLASALAWAQMEGGSFDQRQEALVDRYRAGATEHDDEWEPD